MSSRNFKPYTGMIARTAKSIDLTEIGFIHHERLVEEFI
jgi:hypothetical protein